MAHKSKTQRAKAAAAKANKRDRLEREEAAGVAENAAEATATDAENATKPARAEKKAPKAQVKQQAAAAEKKEDKPKKTRFQFLRDVQAEMKRVTWPSRTDVTRWSVVVVGALLFFGIYTAVLDNVIVTPALVALTSLGA